MNGTRTQKTLRLINHLLSNRQDVLPYIMMGPFQKKTPLDLGLPWFSWGAIRYLDKFIKPGMKVFEWGSGGSTIFFSNRQCSIYSVEDNAEWINRINEKLSNSAHNAILQYEPYDFDNAIDFTDSSYLNPGINMNEFNIIIVDGTERDNTIRPKCFEKAQRSVNNNSIIIVDDSWRYPEIIQASTAKEIKRFQGTGPCRPGVTTTDIHFY